MTTNQPTSDPTNADRQRRIRNRKTAAYTILKALASDLGAIDHTDMEGFDDFVASLDLSAPIMPQLLEIQRR